MWRTILKGFMKAIVIEGRNTTQSFWFFVKSFCLFMAIKNLSLNSVILNVGPWMFIKLYSVQDLQCKFHK